MSLCFFHVVVSALRRYVEPAIWGILSTVEMFLLDSHHLPDAYEDYPVLFCPCHLLKVAFPSLIRNLISGSISEQLVGNYSKRFETHFANGPIYPYARAFFRISERMWRNPFWNRRGFARFGVGRFLGSCMNFRYLGWVLSICPCINKSWEGDTWGRL